MTANYFFTADLHLGHGSIIHHTYRPFNSVKEMDEHIIKMFNETVRPQDVCVICGDTTLESKVIARQYVDRLNGNKIFIKGNHDSWITKEKRYEYHKKVGSVHVYATHYPLRTWPRSFANGFNIHGHCHNQLRPVWYNQLDCGIDTAKHLLGEYRPFSYSEVCSVVEKANEAWIACNQKLWDKITMNDRYSRTAEMEGAIK